MSDLDLIPTRYRRALWLRAWRTRLAVALVAIVIGLAAAKLGLAWGIRSHERALERLRVQKLALLAQEARLEDLQEQRGVLEARVDVLSKLRGGVDARTVFRVVDRALDGNVWFRRWRFRRAGEPVDSVPETARTGYFVVVPRGAEGEPERAWHLETHMELSAEARDHSTLAGFVSRLVQQPEIQDARILHTRARRYPSAEVVEFELAVVVRSG